MKRRQLWLVIGGLLAALCLTATASAGSSKAGHHAATKVKTGGTLVFGSEQEPPCLNPDLNDCQNTWAVYYEQLVLRSAWIINPGYNYVPDLITKATLQLNPQRVTYYINPKAKWNDGTPVSANDFIFTLKTIMNKAWDSKPTGGGIASRVGYNQIVGEKVFGGGKNVTFTFKGNYADWKDLFGLILPQHALQGTDFSKDFINDLNSPKTGKPISDGPFVFTNWNHGSDATLQRNTSWWGAHRPYLDTIVAKFVTNSNTEITSVQGGETDAIYPQPQLPLAQLKSSPGLVVQSHLGPIYEHVDIEVGPKGNPLAKFPWVRQALMMSVDRNALLKAVFSTLNPNLTPLNNVIYFNSFPGYVDHFGRWNYNPAKAKQLIESHGCTKGSDGIYSCKGTRLSFQFESTAGNQLRELAFQVLQQQWKSAGIEVTNNFKPSNIYFGQDLPAGNYQLAMFAWSAPSPDPSSDLAIWGCPSGQGTENFIGYCDKKVDQLLQKGNTTLDPATRRKLYNAADALIAKDLPTIPLYQKPTFLVYHNYVHGMTDNTTSSGPMWDAENWWMSK